MIRLQGAVMPMSLAPIQSHTGGSEAFDLCAPSQRRPRESISVLEVQSDRGSAVHGQATTRATAGYERSAQLRRAKHLPA